MILAGGYAGWKGSLGEEEAKARLAGVRKMLSAPDNQFDPTLPGLFAGDPPAKFVPLLNAMAADVRPRTPANRARNHGKNRSESRSADYCCSDPAIVGRA